MFLTFAGMYGQCELVSTGLVDSVMQLSLAILTYGAAISEVPLFQITILAVQITILVVLKNYYTNSANATGKPNCFGYVSSFGVHRIN